MCVCACACACVCACVCIAQECIDKRILRSNQRLVITKYLSPDLQKPLHCENSDFCAMVFCMPKYDISLR